MYDWFTIQNCYSQEFIAQVSIYCCTVLQIHIYLIYYKIEWFTLSMYFIVKVITILHIKTNAQKVPDSRNTLRIQCQLALNYSHKYNATMHSTAITQTQKTLYAWYMYNVYGCPIMLWLIHQNNWLHSYRITLYTWKI